MHLIPAIDFRGGRVVRLQHGDFNAETDYSLTPGEVAAQFQSAGATHLHAVDLDGAKEGRPVNTESFRAIRAAFDGIIDVGGGIRSLEAAQEVRAIGIDRVVFGTALVARAEDTPRWIEALGDSMIAGVDARDGFVATAGWLATEGLCAADLVAKLTDLGVSRFIVTDIATDGTLAGPNLAFLADLADRTTAQVIASGGVGTLNDLTAIARLARPNLEGVIVGKAIYEGRFSVVDAIQTLAR